MPMTIAEKILAKKSGKEKVSAGEIIEARPDIVMSHYATYRVINVLKKLGVDRLWDKTRLRIIADHRSPPKATEHANHEKIARDFAQKHGIKYYDINEGIAHIVLLENNDILPGMLAVGTDSHTPIYGCVGAFGTGIGYTETASIWLTGKLWMKVPETYKIVLKGQSLPHGVCPKDLILAIIGQLTADGCTYRAVEFYGDLIERMDMAGRMTLSCMSVEMGVKTAIFPPDEVTKKYLSEVKQSFDIVHADEGAKYAQEITFEARDLEPLVSIPHNVDKVAPISKMDRITIHQAFVGSCANGSVEDLKLTAQILKGRKVAHGVRFIVTPASRNVLERIIESGVASQIVESGGILVNPGCSVCCQDGGSIGDGEVCISSSTRNFLARMGSPNSQIYLASPATVAASAIKGEITDPREFL